jgi:hypothetical protein
VKSWLREEVLARRFLCTFYSFSGFRPAPIGAGHGEYFGRDFRITDPTRGAGEVALEQLLTSGVSFKPLQSSVGGGKDGLGVRPTAPGSFCFQRIMRVLARLIFLSADSCATLQPPFIATDSSSLENGRMTFSVSTLSCPSQQSDGTGSPTRFSASSRHTSVNANASCRDHETGG